MANDFLNISKMDYLDEDSKKFDLLIKELQKFYKKSSGNTHSVNNFELIKCQFQVKLGRRFGYKESSGGECNLLEVQYAFRYDIRNKYDPQPIIEEYRAYPFCIFKHSTDLGHVIIRPETLADKVSELFKPVEIDFKSHKKFSFKYFVMADNEALTRKEIPDELLTFLNTKKGLSIEFIGNLCLIRNSKTVDLENGLDLCQTAIEIQKILCKKRKE
ncbi:MAG: hypothetical protein ACI8ZM_005014 [Crocinitomix sp.]|jgi:hypothetical protein